MYNEFFGLLKNPFNPTPDPDYLYLTAQHKEALAAFTYAILARKGFVVLTGDAGTGKTTLLTRVLQRLPTSRVHSSVIVNPTLTPSEFLEAAMLGFGITDIPGSKAQRVAQLQRLLWASHGEGKVSALVVDEAHKLSLEVLEEIRLLGNFESAEQKLLQIALSAQSELDQLLESDQMRQFKQRIAVRVSITALSESDIEQYVRYRWMKASGGREHPFSSGALDVVADASKGIPRVINVLCDNALMQAFAEGSVSVECRHLLAACQDLRLAPPSARGPALPTTAPMEVIAAESPDDFYPMPWVERYSRKRAPSLVARLAGKLGLRERTETA